LQQPSQQYHKRKQVKLLKKRREKKVEEKKEMESWTEKESSRKMKAQTKRGMGINGNALQS
jgi:hypothetical protein